MITICAILFCNLVGLMLYRKFHDKKSSTPPKLIRKVTTLADLAISSMNMTEIKLSPIDEVDSD
jgi:hypothetical protein